MLPDLAGSMRTQVAIVRTLIDEVEHAIAGGPSEDCMREQLVEELARLGSRLIELAAAMGSPQETFRANVCSGCLYQSGSRSS